MVTVAAAIYLQRQPATDSRKYWRQTVQPFTQFAALPVIANYNHHFGAGSHDRWLEGISDYLPALLQPHLKCS
jgi:hypothetical protein